MSPTPNLRPTLACDHALEEGIKVALTSGEAPEASTYAHYVRAPRELVESARRQAARRLEGR